MRTNDQGFSQGITENGIWEFQIGITEWQPKDIKRPFDTRPTLAQMCEALCGQRSFSKVWNGTWLICSQSGRRLRIKTLQYWVLGSSFKLTTSRFDFLYNCNWGFLFSAIYLCATIFKDLATRLFCVQEPVYGFCFQPPDLTQYWPVMPQCFNNISSASVPLCLDHGSTVSYMHQCLPQIAAPHTKGIL